MSDKPGKMGELVDLADAVKRAQEASERRMLSPAEFQEELERDARTSRSRALDVAEPSLSAADVDRLVSGQMDLTGPLRAVHAFTVHPASLLVLHGDIGTGKTFSACWALAHVGGHFVKAMDLLEVFTSFKKADRKEEILRARVLVVDDVGQELDPSRVGPWLAEIVDRRRSHLRKTIWTTNLSPKDLQQRYDDARLWDRVQQCVQPGSGFTGPSLRRRK